MLRRKKNPRADTQVALFADLSRAGHEVLGRATTRLDISAGYEVIREGAHGHDMFVIVSGTVAVTRDGEDVATLGPGEFFGEMAGLGGTRRNATVTTIEPVRVLHVDGRAIPSAIEGNELIASRMAPIVASRSQTSDVRVAA